jgi:transcriptional regulator with XRE-family HTH domain
VLAGDLIVEARRRAGLTQHQLAARTGRRQSTIARWERGVQTPSIDTTREVVRACGLELMVGLARYDDSYLSLIDRQLGLGPAGRLRSLWKEGLGSPVAILAALEQANVGYLLIGRAAGALHGSPLLVSPPELQIVPADDPDNERRLEAALRALRAKSEPLDDRYAGLQTIEPWRLPDRSRIAVVRRPAGTYGYADLRRDANRFDVEGVEVPVASLLDLIRTAEASPRPADRADTVALRTTLERGRPDTSVKAETLTPEEIIASWQRPRI